MLHSAKECTGMCNNLNIKEEMGGSVVSKSDTIKPYKKFGNKRKKYLKALKKKNKMLYSTAKKSVSCREIKDIKKIWEKSSKEGRNSSRNSSSGD